jgi:hypothetical protein
MNVMGAAPPLPDDYSELFVPVGSQTIADKPDNNKFEKLCESNTLATCPELTGDNHIKGTYPFSIDEEFYKRERSKSPNEKVQAGT